MMPFVPRRLTGRCATGGESDGGTVYHAVPAASTWAPAACGAKPGRTSAGWSEDAGERVMCQRCLRRRTQEQE